MNTMVTRFEAGRADAGRVKTISANGHLIHFDSEAAGWRYESLLDKEPETIAWIDSFQPGDSFWDVGANVGIYSVYAAARGVRTLSFEPHFANYQQLCLSIALNGQQDLVTPLCLAFAERKSIGALNLASLDIGTSMSNFGAAVDFRGQPFDAAFRQGMIGYDLDSFVADFDLDVPTHLKIHVDGTELAIVQGTRRTLADERLRSVLIALVESDYAQLSAVATILEEAGLHFIHKKQNVAFATPQPTDVTTYLFHREPVALLSAGTNFEEIDGSVTIDQIIDGIVAKIAAAPIDPVPSANLFMEEMLPANVYQELLARLPQDAALDPIDHPDARTADGRCTRYLLDLTRDSLARLDPEDQPFWLAMIDVFTAPAIARAITAKFAPMLAERFGAEMPELVAVPLLYRDLPGYRIGIHPDAPSKIATLQFYLPQDESQRHLGTVFHRKNPAGFERVKANCFSPNAAYAFVRTEDSWHSVDEIGQGEAPRNSIALTFYIKGQEYRSSDVQPTSPSETVPAQATPDSPQPPAANVRMSAIYDEQMRQALHTLSQTFNRRDDVATLFREGGTGVELGVAAGDFSERILTRSKVGYLYSIDMWEGDRGHDMHQYREAIIRLSPYRDRNTLLRMRFEDALPLFDDHSLDFIYVDGYAHDGELNGQTFRQWLPKLRAGGLIAGDDYHDEWPLVVAAVDAFVAQNGLELHVIDCREELWNSMYPTWFAMKP